MATYKLVLVRHGESEWNKLNKFCGWFDADLSELGVVEASKAGQILKEKGFKFDMAFTSVLKRAIKTLYLMQEQLDLHWLPVERHWRLNERHYGGLQGLNKAETAAKHGNDQVQVWRRSYDTPPPPLEHNSEYNPLGDPKYLHLDRSVLPTCECLKDTVDRVLPYWHDRIVPEMKAGKKLLISAHGNSLRALVKYLDNIPDKAGKKLLISAHGNSLRALVKYLDNIPDSEITGLNIPTGIPLVYELDADLKPIKHYYLGSDEQVRAATEKVAAQGIAAPQQ